MGIAQRGGYTLAEQRREWLRRKAVERFARGNRIDEIARDLRVTPESVRRWHRAGRDGGTGGGAEGRGVTAERSSSSCFIHLSNQTRIRIR